MKKHRPVRLIQLALAFVLLSACAAWLVAWFEPLMPAWLIPGREPSTRGADAPKELEARLRVALSGAVAREAGFIVATSYAESLSVDYSLPPVQLLGVAVGSAEGQASAWYRVDLGVDLRSGTFELRCADTCVWRLPHPQARTVAIDLETLSLDTDTTGWDSADRDRELRALLLELLDLGTDARVHSPAFWSVTRETVRVGLERFARDTFGADVPVSVVFEGEGQLPRG